VASLHHHGKRRPYDGVGYGGLLFEGMKMTTTNNPFLDNLSRLMTDAAGMATGMKREAETVMRAQFERLIRDMDVVSREEFEAVRAMAIAAREENERLAERIAELESKQGK
jgi:BMFP domain-containing protein YqiC